MHNLRPRALGNTCRRSLVVAIVVFGLAAEATPALARSRDVSATHAAVLASYALARTSVANIKVAQANVQSFDRKLAAECPGAGAGAPETSATDPMSHEVAAAMWSIQYGTVAGPIKKFAKAINPLHWTSSRVDRVVHTLAAHLTALATIQLPDICGDVRAFTASGFTVVPQHALELNRHVEPLDLPEIPWKLVASFLRGHDVSLVRYIVRAQTKLTEAEIALGQKDWYQLLETVGLPP